MHGHPKFKHDSSKWSWQRLGDAIWLIPAAWGYDLIHNSSSLSDADRDAIENKFIMPCVKNIMRSSSIIGAPTNWSVICCAAVMIGARVCDDEGYYKKALLGNKGDKKSGIYFHLDKGIDDDGMWAEGAIGYQFMAIRGLIVMAEILWHDDIDIYSYRDNRLKLVFDSPIWYCYPGGSNAPAVHDSGSASLYGRDAHLYQYAQRRYGDKTYNSILHKITPTFESIYNLFLPACDFKQVDAADLPAIPSILFPGVGFTINRTGFGDDSKYLFMDYGPNRSHGHDDKLNFNVFALGQELFGDAGSAWYSTDLYRMYYPYSIAHNTLTANEQSQIRSGGRLEVYGTAADMAIVRASSDKAIPAAAMDRTMFMNDGRLYDIFWYAGGIPFSLDLLYHGNGQLSQDVANETWEACPKNKPGYAYFTEPKIGAVDKDWKASWTVKNGQVDLHYIGETGTELVATKTPHGGRDAPTVMVRRQGTNTVFAGAFDIIKQGDAASITSINKQQNDQCYLLSSEIADGSTEYLLVNFTDKTCSIGDWSFDGRLAFMHMKNGGIERFYIAGGSSLKNASHTIDLSLPSLVAYQRISPDVAGLWNQSVEACTVTIKNLSGFTHVVSANGREAIGDAITLAPEALTELHNGEQPRISDLLDQRMRSKREAQIAAEAAERKRLQDAFDQQLVDAMANKPSAQAKILIQAEDIAEESGGKVGITSKKTATYGAAFSGWNKRNHTLKYTFEVQEAGYYQLHVKYCREGDEQLRSIMIDGSFPCEYAKAMTFPGTGGWSNGSDNWKLIPLTWGKVLDKPFFIKLDAGQHTMTLNNLSGSGLNLDYVVLTPANTEVTKASVEQ